MNTAAVSLSEVSRKFGEFWANREISLEIRSGSIHAIVGENGAGKSTLTRMIYGLLPPTSGSISVRGQLVRFTSPRQAIAAGIGMVHQHFMLIPDLTVTENIILGDERGSLFAPLKKKEAARKIQSIAETHGLDIDHDAVISDLSVGEEQRVEILKLLYREANILILDEPTAVLTPSETSQLFTTLTSLRNEGKTVILITHKLDEVLSVSDTVSVMRRGRVIATKPTATVTKSDLARLMVGRNILLRVENPPENPGKTVLKVVHTGFTDRKGRKKLNDLSFAVRAGEIYGIAGVEGNGQSELLSILWGMVEPGCLVSGSITMNDHPLKNMNPAEIAATGVSHIPEDRLRHAVIKDFPVSENMIFGRHREKRFLRLAGFNAKAVRAYTNSMIDRYDIRCGTESDPPLSGLSGGNQQKTVLAREIERPGLRLLILAQPTRGVDIGAIEMIHKKIIETRDKGIAILLISAELDEIISLSSRIGCIYKGSIRHEFSTAEIRRGRTCEQDFEKEIGMFIT